MAIRILVVDDDRDALRQYKQALILGIKSKRPDPVIPEGAAGPVIEVEDVDTFSLALEKLKTQSFEIFVIDLKIPGIRNKEMGGLDLIEESIKADPLRLIIVITGFGTVELARKTLTQGVFDFIEKSRTAIDDLVEAVQKAIEHLDEKIKRSGNPFTPRSGMEPTVFGGRTQELEFFEDRLNRAIHSRFCEHFLVLGDWGIGKSTLLKEYKKICQARGHLASIVPLEYMQVGSRLDEAAKSIVEGILRELPLPVHQFRKVLDFFDSIGFSILGFGAQAKKDTSKKDFSPMSFLYNTLIRLWKDVEDKTGAFIILLDDLEHFIAVSEIIMTLKQTLSTESITKTRILVGIASTPTTWHELTALKKHHPLARYFLSRVELTQLNKKEMEETISKSLAGTGVSFNPEVIDRIFEFTQGHPFEMQLLSYHLFNNQLSRRVSIDVWDKAMQFALKDMDTVIFHQWFDQASSEEAKILSVLSKADGPKSIKDINILAEECKIKISSQNITKYLQRLAGKKLVNKTGRGLYIIPDRMFRTYISSQVEWK